MDAGKGPVTFVITTKGRPRVMARIVPSLERKAYDAEFHLARALATRLNTPEKRRKYLDRMSDREHKALLARDNESSGVVRIVGLVNPADPATSGFRWRFFTVGELRDHDEQVKQA